VQATPISERTEEEKVNLKHILQPGALESLGHKRKWHREKGRHQNDHTEKVINDKRETFKKFLSTGETR
jgi:hypothetical protein